MTKVECRIVEAGASLDRFAWRVKLGCRLLECLKTYETTNGAKRALKVWCRTMEFDAVIVQA